MLLCKSQLATFTHKQLACPYPTMIVLLIINMFLAGPPSSPVNVASSVQQYGRSNVSIILQWDPPVDSGGTSVDNYTITVTGPTMQELTSLGPTASTTVVYIEMYTVNVRASNCVGSSGSATANIFEGKNHVLKGWVCLSTSTSLLVYWLTHSNWHGISLGVIYIMNWRSHVSRLYMYMYECDTTALKVMKNLH